MTKLIGLACAIAFLFFLAKPQNDKFSKYKAIETHEIRPGILMMPRYSAGGHLCEILIEKHHYVNGIVNLDSTIKREELTQIIDELVPASERGPLTTDKEMARLSIYAGNTVTLFDDYENVSVDISRLPSSPGDVVAVIKWKEQTCQ